MADEKDTTSDIDDWLDDLDDSDEFSGELDQDNIDALLDGAPESDELDVSGVDEEEGSVDLDQTNIDALLGATDNSIQAEPDLEADSSQELDQSNIDLLLGGDPDDAAPQEAAAEESGELDQDNIDALLSGGDDVAEESGELDQDNIDALLSGDDDVAEESGELDQDNIDALLSGGDDVAEESGELDQDNIDDLLSADDDSSELEQDNIDALLSGAADEDVLGEEAFGEVGEDGLDVDQDEIDQLFSGLDDEDEVDDPFEDDDLDFADVLGEDDDGLLDLGDEVAGDEATASGNETVASVADAVTDGLGAAQVTDEEKKSTGFLPFLPVEIDRTVASVILACLVLLIGVSFFFFGTGGEEQSAIIVVDGEQVAQNGEKAAMENYIPEVADSSYQMPESGGEVAVLLTGQDEDGDPLTFEITNQPQHGRLSGELPALTYLPNSDFPGEDRFEYTVSDGKDSGNMATVLITGPNLLQIAAKKEAEKAEEKKKSFSPRKPVVLAMDITYKTKSTDGVTIDWSKMWREVNRSAYSSKIHVDIDTSAIQGKLTKTGASTYRYQPDPFFDGKEVITYRFKRGGLSSRTGKVVMLVRLGSPAPEIHLKNLAKAYPVGSTVMLDATPTRDESRGSVSFSWEQVSGVPVLVEMMNEEGSLISFSMPSSFYTGPNPGPVMRLTAVDETGKNDVMDIKVPMVSRRQAALWRGVGRGVAEDPPLEGRFLPWPYDD